MKSATELFDLTGRVALVTGASRGLGKVMVHAFAAAGADVVITSRKVENCREVVREIEQTYGRRALAYGCHVGRWGELDGLVDAAYGAFGKVDVLVNNAGMSPTYDDVTGISEKLWDSVFNINLKGPSVERSSEITRRRRTPSRSPAGTSAVAPRSGCPPA